MKPGSVRVTHVTEAMGGGIVTFVDSISRRQTEAGASVAVLYTRRPDTPSAEDMRARFHPDVALTEIAAGSRSRDLLAIARAVAAAVRKGDVVHLHSSFAGVAGRIAAGWIPRARVFYSPHGFAFLRESSSNRIRVGARLLESALSRLGRGLIVTSATEVTLAHETLRAPRVTFLQSGVPSSLVATTPHAPSDNKRPIVGMIGRVTYQKGPWRFAAVAQELEDLADFIWVGDGKAEDTAAWLDGKPVAVTGWLPSDELKRTIDTFDVLLFPSLWEGMSLALIQAQAQGIPAVVTDIVGNRDTVLDGETGFVCATEEDLIAGVRTLLEDPQLRLRMSDQALKWARERLTDDNIGRDSLAIYAR